MVITPFGICVIFDMTILKKIQAGTNVGISPLVTSNAQREKMINEFWLYRMLEEG